MISVPAFLFVFASLLSMFGRRRDDRAELNKFLVSAISLASLVCLFVPLCFPGAVVGDVRPLSGLMVLEIVVVCVVMWALPTRVFSSPEAPILYLLQGILLEGLVTESLWMFVAVGILGALGVSFLAESERRRRQDDPIGSVRLKVYMVYRLISLIGLIIFAVSILQSAEPFFLLSQLSHLPVPLWGRAGLTVALMSSLAIFPLHGWFPLFMSAPRLNMLTPIFVVELGILILARLFIPIWELLEVSASLVTTGAAFGVVYFAVLLFGENRLKRIVGYLLLSHISVMVLILLTSHTVNLSRVLIDVANVLISGAGLLICVTILVSRFGVQGVASPTGLAKPFPEVAACFLLCSLSLVGFPGTVGFMSEEAFLSGFSASHVVFLVVIVTATALNGYSCFRLFAGVFYGRPNFDIGRGMDLTLGERSALRTIMVLLIIIGLAPQVLLFASGL